MWRTASAPVRELSHPSNLLGGMLSLVRAAARGLERLLAPEHCVACDAPVPADEIFCSRCGPCPDPPPTANLLDDAWVAGTYAPPLSTAIRRFKFSHRADLAAPLSRLLLWPVQTGSEIPTVVPVPLHFSRLVERGFNPAGLLAKALSERVRAPFRPELLERWRETPQQSRLSGRERRHNVAGAFVARPCAAGCRVVLVDDVISTGSTIDACRRALVAAGAVRVRVVALAAAPPP